MSLMREARFIAEYLMSRSAGAAMILSLIAGPVGAQENRSDITGQHWVGTWATAVVGRPSAISAPQQTVATPTATTGGQPSSAAPLTTPPAARAAQPASAAREGAPRTPPPPPVQFNNQTLRQIVRTSIGGERVRLVLSNRFGTAPMNIGAVHLALRDKESAIVAASDHAVVFSGRTSVVIPAAAVVMSDPIDLAVPAQTDLAIDLYLPSDTATSPSPLTMHAAAFQTNYVSTAGNHAGETALPVAATTQSWFLLARVEVVAPAGAGAVITFGDSITDGSRSSADSNGRWPDHLARRLLNQPGATKLGVLNLAIAGNRVLSEALPNFGINALARFDDDVLAQPGATHLVVMEGINDIGMARPDSAPTAADIIAGHRQLIDRAHAHGLKVLGATLTPYEGAAYYNPQGEALRQEVNQWIRSGGAYDGVIDFDALVRDAAAPTKIQSQYDSGDHLHPGDAGYAAMGNAIELTLFAGR
jgi:lysophospholipase L1-like esterase